VCRRVSGGLQGLRGSPGLGRVGGEPRLPRKKDCPTPAAGGAPAPPAVAAEGPWEWCECGAWCRWCCARCPPRLGPHCLPVPVLLWGLRPLGPRLSLVRPQSPKEAQQVVGLWCATPPHPPHHHTTTPPQRAAQEQAQRSRPGPSQAQGGVLRECRPPAFVHKHTWPPSSLSTKWGCEHEKQGVAVWFESPHLCLGELKAELGAVVVEEVWAELGFLQGRPSVAHAPTRTCTPPGKGTTARVPKAFTTRNPGSNGTGE